MVWDDTLHLRPEALTMVVLNGVTKFMHDDVVCEVFGEEGNFVVKA